MVVGAVEGKAWGSTQCVFALNNVEVHRIDVIGGGYCSRHRHASKFNQFYVESGQLTVKIFRGGAGTGDAEDVDDVEPVDTTVLGRGMSTVIRPGEVHQFEATGPTVAYEIYYAMLEHDDITRLSCGGVLPQPK